MTRGGSLFELPMPAHPMPALESSSSRGQRPPPASDEPRLLPTPVASETSETSPAMWRRHTPGMRAIDAMLKDPTIGLQRKTTTSSTTSSPTDQEPLPGFAPEP